jgi:hypothetical protein
MRRIHKLILGALACGALLTGTAGAALAAVSVAPPVTVTNPTAIEY